MKVSFKTGAWADFYRKYADLPDKIDPDRVWINCSCVLPTHPKEDTGQHGGINLTDGRYKCFNTECTDAWKVALAVSTESLRESLTAPEFLMVVEGIDRYQADGIVDSFRLEGIYQGQDPSSVHMNDFSKVYRPSWGWDNFMRDAQRRLDPNLPIVREYMSSRGLSFETLKEAGMGYVPEGPEQLECLIHPYISNGRVVGIRGRTLDGRKGGVKGSYATLYGLQTLPDKADTVCLVEGETDTLILRQALKDRGHGDIPVLGIPGATWDISWNRHIQAVRRIVFVSQTDQASQRLAQKIVQALHGKVRHITPPFPPQAIGKDVADFFRLGEDHVQTLIRLLAIPKTHTDTLPYLMNLTDLRREAEKERAWLITGVIERGTKFLMVGEPKTRKTFLAIEMASALATGRPWLRNPVWTVPGAPLRTLIVEEEGSIRDLGDRMVHLVPSATSEDLIHVIFRKSVRFDDDISLDQLWTAILQVDPDLIILDPYASIHGGRDENDATETSRNLRTMGEILDICPKCCVGLIHHTNTQGGVRGSTALWGGMDGKLTFRKVSKTSITIHIEGRAIEEIDPITVDFDPMTYEHTARVAASTAGSRYPAEHLGDVASNLFRGFRPAQKGAG